MSNKMSKEKGMTKREKKLLTHLIKMSQAVSHPLNQWGNNTYLSAQLFIQENYDDEWLECMNDAEKFQELLEKEEV